MAEKKKKAKPANKPEKRPRDANQLAKWIVEQSTNPLTSGQKNHEKDAYDGK
jgi:hypothetical protein